MARIGDLTRLGVRRVISCPRLLAGRKVASTSGRRPARSRAGSPQRRSPGTMRQVSASTSDLCPGGRVRAYSLGEKAAPRLAEHVVTGAYPERVQETVSSGSSKKCRSPRPLAPRSCWATGFDNASLSSRCGHVNPLRSQRRWRYLRLMKSRSSPKRPPTHGASALPTRRKSGRAGDCVVQGARQVKRSSRPSPSPTVANPRRSRIGADIDPAMTVSAGVPRSTAASQRARTSAR